MSARRQHLAVVAVGAIALIVPACRDSASAPKLDRPTTTSTTTTIPRAGIDGALVLGQLAPLTGSVSPIADAFTTPVRLAVDEMNIAGGVNGNAVALVVADDGSAVTTAQGAFAKLVDGDSVDAIVGPSSSEIAADLIPEARSARVVMCSGSNSSGALSTQESGGFYFRTAPPDRVQATALAQLVVAEGHTRPVIIAPRDTYGVPFGNGVRSALRSEGIRSVPFETYPPGGDPTAAVNRAVATNPDAIVIVGFPQGSAAVIRALGAKGRGPTQIPTYASDGLQSADLGTAVDPANPATVAGLKGTTPAGVPVGIEHPFNARMLAAGVEPFFSASTYDCAILIGLAAVSANSDDPTEIAGRFTANLHGDVDCTGFLDCRTLLESGRTIHYRGAFSNYNGFDRFEPTSGVFDVWTLGLDSRPTLAPPSAQIAIPAQ